MARNAQTIGLGIPGGGVDGPILEVPVPGPVDAQPTVALPSPTKSTNHRLVEVLRPLRVFDNRLDTRTNTFPTSHGRYTASNPPVEQEGG